MKLIKPFSVIVLAGLLGSAVAVESADTEKCQALLIQEDYEAAVTPCTGAAQQGDANAQTRLAVSSRTTEKLPAGFSRGLSRDMVRRNSTWP